MIEILLHDNIGATREKFLFIVKLINWITQIVVDIPDPVLDGYVVLNDEPQHVGVVILTKRNKDKQLLDILFQPPEEFKGRYTPCIVSEEPKPIVEKIENENESESDEDKKDEKT